MASKFSIKLVRFLGWLLFIISLFVIIAGIVSITSSDSGSMDFWLIGIFALFAAFGFFLTRYKKRENADISEKTDLPKKSLSEKLQEQKEKSIQKQAELQEKIDALKNPPKKETPPPVEKPNSTNRRIKTLEQLITQYQDSYYNGEAEISDDEFDRLWDELKTLNPDSSVLKKTREVYSEPPKKEHQPKSGTNIFHIEYVDYSGKPSSRDIEINGFVEENEKLYINAYCHKANAMRQFMVDRVQSISIQGGDPIDNPQQFLWNKYQNSDIYKTQMALNDHADEILALVFLAKSDGKMLKNEREVIGRYIDIIAPGIDAEAVEKTLKNTTCELSQFNGILKRAKSWESDTKKLVMDAASQIKALKKQLDPMEKATYEKLEAVIG